MSLSTQERHATFWVRDVGSGSNHRKSSARLGKRLEFDFSMDTPKKPLPTLGTFTADIMSIDPCITCKTDFVVINGDSRSLLCKETAEKLDLLRVGPSHAVNSVSERLTLRESTRNISMVLAFLRITS